MRKTNRIIGTIPARMASSRFYAKPLAKILGKEMLQWTYEYSKGSRILDEVHVATDHEDIASFCRKASIPYLITSPDHRNCSERSNEVCQRLKADFIVEIQGDEPTLETNDLDRFLTKALEYSHFDVATQYTEITEEQANDPHNVKVVVGPDSRALFFSRCPIPHNFKSKHPTYFKQVGLFIWRAGSIERFSKLPVSYLESIEDTHMLRLVEHRFDIAMVHTDRFTVGVDVPEQIPEAEEFLKARGSALEATRK